MEKSYEEKISHIRQAFDTYYSENTKDKKKERKEKGNMIIVGMCPHIVETKDDCIVFADEDGDFYKLGYSFPEGEDVEFEELSKAVEVKKEYVPVDLKKKVNKMRDKTGKREYDDDEEIPDEAFEKLEKEADYDTTTALKRRKFNRKKKRKFSLYE